LASGKNFKADPGDVVFLFARAAQGPRMPLAVLRAQVKDLPLTFTLDNSMAVMPARKLSDADTVVVGARISKSGSATPQSGDLEGFSAPVAVGSDGVEVVIDHLVP
jgi:cytochrome c-type biogenesis protein CcmH